jgi:ABC-type glycerol-3-phosphate transport system substrate-binding protein
MKNFQVIVLIIFALLGGLAVAFFSGAIKLPEKGSSATANLSGVVTMWGTIPRSQILPTLTTLSNYSGELNLRYVEKSPLTYERDLLDAFAFGGAPDLFLLPNNLINLYKDKVVAIPYQTFTERMIEDSYARGVSVFKTEAGLLGYPIFADPLVMFYNKDHFESKNIIMPPKTWNEFNAIVPILTEKNQVLEISRSAVALGESTNVRHFKKILSALNLQLGNQITVRNTTRATYEPVFSSRSSISANPAEETLRFYLEFSNPLRSAYSWNKSMPESLNAFVAGDLSIYFGPASEISLVQRMNPNLNFDIAELPQVDGSTTKITYADMYAVAISRTSQNFQGAFYLAGQLASGPFTSSLAASSGMAPVRRDLLANKSLTKYTEVFYPSALSARSWVDPSDVGTNAIFSAMIESVLSGLKDYGRAVGDANTELRVLLLK